MGELAATCQALRPHVTWGELPYDKTLGNLLVFLPFGAMNNLDILPEVVVHKLIIILLTLVAHIAMYYFIAELRNRHATLPIMLTLSNLFYMWLMGWTLYGLSDAISILFIILTVRFLREGNNTIALLCYSLAVFMHYRALYLLPLGVYALLNLYKEGKLSLATLLRASTSAKAIYGFTAVAGVLTIYTAYLTFIEFPYASIITDISIPLRGICANPLNLESFSPAVAIPVFAITGATIFFLVREGELLTASTVATSLIFFSLLPLVQITYTLFLHTIPLSSKEERGRRVVFFWLLLTTLTFTVSIYHREIFDLIMR